MQEKIGNPPMDHDFKWVGTNQIRPDGMDKVTGKARFIKRKQMLIQMARTHGIPAV